MNFSIHDRMVQLGLTQAEVARQLHERWDQGGQRKHRSPRSLAGELRKLDRGDGLGWWRARPEAAQALARILQIDVGDLGLDDGAHATFRFVDFPVLPAFDPRSDSPWRGATLAWLDVPSDPEVALWVRCPPGAGRSFACHWHRARGTATAISTVSVAAAMERIPDEGSVLIEVESLAPEPTLEQLAQLGARGDVTVLGPTEPPRLLEPPVLPGHEATQHERELHERHMQVLEGWRSIAWSVHGEWPDSFVHWLANRLPPNHRGLGMHLRSWLATLDPDQTLFRTPGDIIALCGLVAEQPGDAPRDLVTRWLDNLCNRAAVGDSPRSRWLRQRGARTIDQVVRSHWDQLDTPWGAPMLRERWEALIPDDCAPKVERDPSSESDQVVLIPDRAEAVDYLIGARLLRYTRPGWLAFRPFWVMELIARDHVSQIVESDTLAWGLTAMDVQRGSLVAKTLDELGENDPDTFHAVIERVVGTPATNDIAAIAAVEALFSSTGRLLASGWRPKVDISSLWRQQMDSLYREFSTLPAVPLTRISGYERRSAGTAWLCECWAWSLSAPTPEEPIPEDMIWLFPGWTRPCLARLTDQEPCLSHFVGDDESSDHAWLLEMSHEVVACCSGPGEGESLPDALPFELIPAVLAAAPERHWVVPPGLVRRFLGFLPPRPAQHLGERFASWDEERQRHFARVFWQAALPDLWNALRRLRERIGPPLSSVIDFLDEDTVIQACVGEPVLTDWLAYLPPRLRAPVVRWAIASNHKSAEDIRRHVERTGDDVDMLLAALEGAKWPYRLIQRIWHFSPETALHRAGTELAQNGTLLRAWFGESPYQHAAPLLSLLEEAAKNEGHGAVPWTETWLGRWLVRRVRHRPDLAERIEPLLARCRAAN